MLEYRKTIGFKSPAEDTQSKEPQDLSFPTLGFLGFWLLTTVVHILHDAELVARGGDGDSIYV